MKRKKKKKEGSVDKDNTGILLRKATLHLKEAGWSNQQS